MYLNKSNQSQQRFKHILKLSLNYPGNCRFELLNSVLELTRAVGVVLPVCCCLVSRPGKCHGWASLEKLGTNRRNRAHHKAWLRAYVDGNWLTVARTGCNLGLCYRLVQQSRNGFPLHLIRHTALSLLANGSPSESSLESGSSCSWHRPGRLMSLPPPTHLPTPRQRAG
jgi:hypothetical protein